MLILAFLGMLFYALTLVLRIFFGIRQTARKFAGAMGGTDKKDDRQQQKQETKKKKKSKKKMFDRNEGDYVDFEEIKN